MQTTEFESIKEQFRKANLEDKIQMYVSTSGLSSDQYTELLRLFPIDQINKLEAALGSD